MEFVFLPNVFILLSVLRVKHYFSTGLFQAHTAPNSIHLLQCFNFPELKSLISLKIYNCLHLEDTYKAGNLLGCKCILKTNNLLTPYSFDKPFYYFEKHTLVVFS